MPAAGALLAVLEPARTAKHDVTMCDMNGVHAGRVVLITGAGAGVGRGYALACARLSERTGLSAPSS